MATVRPATKDDIERIVSIHMRAFEGFFLTFMGKRFLRELYRNFTLEQEGICLVAEEGNDVIGFVAGTICPEVFLTRIRKRRRHVFLMASIGSILRRPFLVTRRLISALSYKGDKPPKCKDAALLSSIAVDPDFSGKGAGQLLLKAFCKEVRDAGSDFVYLTTDRDDNERINKLYQESGFELESTFAQLDNRNMNRHLLNLRGPENE